LFHPGSSTCFLSPLIFPLNSPPPLSFVHLTPHFSTAHAIALRAGRRSPVATGTGGPAPSPVPPPSATGAGGSHHLWRRVPPCGQAEVPETEGGVRAVTGSSRGRPRSATVGREGSRWAPSPFPTLWAAAGAGALASSDGCALFFGGFAPHFRPPIVTCPCLLLLQRRC
jgi:hypothetical protein